MNFKSHLFIICIIIAVVGLIGLEISYNTFVPAVQAPVKGAPVQALSITHASWGLNCLNHVTETATAPKTDAYARQPVENKAHPDNVLSQVALLCNGKDQCDINVNPSVLGEEPSPDCHNKSLDIEYRCFSYDRPWNISTTNNPVTLRCNYTSDNTNQQ